jgi:hypothetical protein
MHGIEDKPTNPNTMASMDLSVRPLPEDHDKVISLPAYAGTYNHGAYFDWEFEIDHIFGCHNLQTMEK